VPAPADPDRRVLIAILSVVADRGSDDHCAGSAVTRRAAIRSPSGRRTSYARPGVSRTPITREPGST
jgi:hypothetical protein